VDVHVIISENESEIYQNIMRKDAMAKRLRGRLIDQIRTYEEDELGLASGRGIEDNSGVVFTLPEWLKA